MGSNILISIIIAVYNGEKYLRECLWSIVNQDYANLEIILINDGSTDNSLKILKEFEKNDSRIIVIDQDNSGVCNSRNKGINMSKGEYICIIDQDDIISKNYVSYLLNLCIENNAEISLTPSADKFFGNTNEYIIQDNVKILTGYETAIEMLYHKIVISPWNKIFSRKIIDKYSIKFNTELFNGEGFAFSVQCFQHANRVAIGKEIVYHYRVGDPESGASIFKEQYIHSSINAQKYIKDTFVKETPELLKAWKFSNWHTYCDCLNIIVGCGAEKKSSDLYNSIKKVCKSNAKCAFNAPISLQQKIRGILFMVSPYFASKIINLFRKRKFKKINN